MAHAIAANLPTSAHGSGSEIPSIVARRLVDTLWYLSKNSPNIARELLMDGGFEQLLDLLRLDVWIKSAGNLESCLLLLDTIAAPLVALPEVVDKCFEGGEKKEKKEKKEEKEEKEKEGGEGGERGASQPMDVVKEDEGGGESKDDGKEDEVIEIPPEMGSNGKAAKYVFVRIPRPVIGVERLSLLCGILRLEACKDSSFGKVMTIMGSLSRVRENRQILLKELGTVAESLGGDALRDLTELNEKLSMATKEVRSGERQMPKGAKRHKTPM